MSAEWQGVKSAGNEGTQTRQRSTFRSSRSRCDNMCIVPADPWTAGARAVGLVPFDCARWATKTYCISRNFLIPCVDVSRIIMKP